jgi:hypothetical protein
MRPMYNDSGIRQTKPDNGGFAPVGRTFGAYDTNFYCFALPASANRSARIPENGLCIYFY